MIGRSRVEPLIKGRTIRNAANLFDFHRRPNFSTDTGLGDTKLGQHRLLTFGRGAAVTAHRRHHVGMHARLAQRVHRCLDDLRQIGDAAATSADGYGSTRFHARQQPTFVQSSFGGGGYVWHLGCVKCLFDGQQCLWQIGREM